MRGRRGKERARAKERVVARARVRPELRIVYVRGGGVLASGFAGREEGVPRCAAPAAP